MMKRLSIKGRIGLYYTAVLVLMAALIMGLLLFTTDYRLNESSVKQLKNAVHEGVNNLKFDAGSDNDDYEFELESDFKFFVGGVTLVVLDDDGNLMFGQYPEGFDDADAVPKADSMRLVKSEGNEWRVYDVHATFDKTSVWVRGLYSMALTNSAVASLTAVALIGLPIFIVLAVFAGTLVTKRAFRPLNRIMETAKSISGGQDLSVRIDIPQSKDEIYELAAVMNRMIARLEESFEAEKRFSQDVSHELKNPIAVIMSECEYAIDKGEDGAENESYEVILAQCEKMRSTIVSLMEIGKDGADSLEPEELSARELAGVVCDMMQQKADEREISLENACGAEKIWGDELQLTRLFENLVSNAVKYGVDGGHVWIRSKKAGRFTEIEVEDDGIGIAKENLDKVFGRFFREDRKRDAGDSAGLGLAIAKWIAVSHGGNISVKSEKGKGTCFKVLLPSKK